MNERVLQRCYNINIAVNESLKRHSRQIRMFHCHLNPLAIRIYVVYQTIVHMSSAIRMKECIEQPLLRESFIQCVLIVVCRMENATLITWFLAMFNVFSGIMLSCYIEVTVSLLAMLLCKGNYAPLVPLVSLQLYMPIYIDYFESWACKRCFKHSAWWCEADRCQSFERGSSTGTDAECWLAQKHNGL